MIQICALASGSNGNCYYIGNKDEAILVDIGISNRQLTSRVKSVGLSIKKIKAVFISHEHSDHVKGTRIVTTKNEIQAYTTRKTYLKTRRDFRPDNVNYFEPGDTITIGKIKVHAFSKNHDAVEPVSFRIEIDNISVAVLTDVGIVDSEIENQLSKCSAAFIEANYEHEILMNGKYPAFLKQRVSSDYGHLSNSQAFNLVNSIKNSLLKTVFLSHISADNNRIDLVMDLFKPIASKFSIYPTSRFAPSEVVEL